MSLSTSKLALGAFVVSLLALSGHPIVDGQTAGQGDASELSGPPHFNLSYQARDPRRCKAMNIPPRPEQVAASVQCTMDQERATGLFLMQEVATEMGLPRKYDVDVDSDLKEIDPNAPVFPLTGSLKMYWCSPVGTGYPAGKNCQVSPMPQALGKCWKTTFGDWKCNLTGPAPDSRTGVAGPTDY